MPDIVLQHDVAALLSAKIGSAFTAATAAGTGDNTAVTGSTIDRASGAGRPSSAALLILWQATLAAAATLTIKSVKVEHSDDGSSWSDYLTYTDPGVVGTGQTGGSTEKGVVKLACDLSSAKRYVRLDFTPDLSAANTDTASIVGAMVLAGFDRLPAA